MKVKSLSHAQLLVTPGTAAYQAPPSMGFSRQEYWSGLPSPSLDDVILGVKIRGATRMLTGKLTFIVVLLCTRRSATFGLSFFTSPTQEVGELTGPGF